MTRSCSSATARARQGITSAAVSIPADYLNEGRYVLGVNASSYRVQRYFQDEQALIFTVDAGGAAWHAVAGAAPGP